MKYSFFIFLVVLIAEISAYAKYYGDSHSNCLKCRPYESCTWQDKYSGFRTIDGHCNNLEYTTWGATKVPMRRFAGSDYSDSKDVPRGYPGFYPILPSANLVSSTLFKVEPPTEGNRKRLSTLFMTFGQFIDHDITETPSSAPCTIKNCAHKSSFKYPCFPILFKYTNDHKSSKCSPFTRSRPVCRYYKGAVREQMNTLTSFVDGSQIYSPKKKHFKVLRKSDGSGQMKISAKGLLPLDPEHVPCKISGGCSLVGDERGDENIALHAMHTLWLREHNRIAKGLKKMNTQWGEDVIFNNARKINAAQWQRIVYREWLPQLTRKIRFRGYKKHVNPGLFNSFSTAAFRFGHSLIPDVFPLLDKNFDELHKPIKLQNAFMNRKPIDNYGIETIMYGLTGNQSQEVDTKFADSILKKLFIKPGKSGHGDLTARNIQRGRDHGLPTYGVFRERCNLREVRTWKDLYRYMPSDAVKGFKLIYAHPYDIDLYAAGIAEHHLGKKAIGPTFECIIRKQFRALQDGDRFFYRAKGVFTKKQRRALYKVRMSTILCNNLRGIVSIQKNAFKVPKGRKNRRRGCRHGIPTLDLKPWKDASDGLRYNDDSNIVDDLEDEDEASKKSGIEKEPDFNLSIEEGLDTIPEDDDDDMDDDMENEDAATSGDTGNAGHGEPTALKEYNLEPKDDEAKDSNGINEKVLDLLDDDDW